MNFEDTNGKVIIFYAEFHKTFSEIDNKFELLDKSGGSNQQIAIAIVKDLLSYHSKVYDHLLLSTNGSVFSELQERVNKAGNNIEEYAVIVKTLQQTIHDFLIYDTQWPGQTECKDMIETVLNVFSEGLVVTSEQENGYYATIRILRELVADCAISIKGLYPLAKWSYGTIAYSHLTANEQLIVLINQTILIDRMYFCLQSLEITLNRLNKLVEGFEKLKWTVYYVVGFMNFKIHQYNEAISNFEKVQEHEELKNSYDQSVRERYFHANLLVAYSYEYEHEFYKAIETLALKPDNIDKILEKYSIDSIEINFNAIMDEICSYEQEKKKSLLHKYFLSYSTFYEKAKKTFQDNQLELKMQFEILHALAHCLNEYAIKNRTENQENGSINYGRFIRLARCIMRNIALIQPEYWTCYATMHGEYQDYYKALCELDNAQDKLISHNSGIGKETSLAEISFFRYYFNLLCNHISKSDKRAFEQYYEKYDDDDAKCHFKIFEFRDELRRYLSTLYNSLYSISSNSSYGEDVILKIDEELEKKYAELCSLKPTLYMNANVRTELRLMQRAYICIKSLRTYLSKPNSVNLNELRNSSYRFSAIKDVFKFADSSNKSDFDDVNSSLLPDVVKDAFSTGKASILSSLFSTDSIFILAPISNVAVYQYQTGTVQELFGSQSIIPHDSELAYEDEDIESIIHALFGAYSKLSATAGQREIINIDWDWISKYADVLFFWSNDEAIASQVLIAEKEALSYIRQIEDVETFTNTMIQLKKAFDADRKRQLCKDSEVRRTHRNLKCTLQHVKLPWLEIVNESNTSRWFYIAWDDTVERTTDRNTIICFLLPCVSQNEPDNRNLHICINCLHQYIRKITVKYKPDESNYYFATAANKLEEFNGISDADIQENHELSLNSEDALCKEIEVLKKTANAKRGDINHRLEKLRSQQDKYKKDPNNPNVLPIREKIDKYNQFSIDIESILDYIRQDAAKIDVNKLRKYQVILNQIEVDKYL